MKLLKALLLLCLLIGSVWALNRPWGGVPAIGPMLMPQTGWIASGGDHALTFDEAPPHLQSNATVWVDDRWVPHIRTGNLYDLYYLQGYIHAWHRLWQMDMQTRAAAGRISEVAGPRAIEFDRGQRRKGMVYGAENSLQMMEQDPQTKLMLDAYTSGVNDFIDQLKVSELPVEYKLMSFAPERWTNLKTALMLKMMADDLSGKTDDFALSWLRSHLPDSLFQILYPERIGNEYPVVPSSNSWKGISAPQFSLPPDSFFVPLSNDSSLSVIYDEPAAVGSNNWAVTGSRTASGAPILCNDPHLGLTLPSLWMEMQLQCDDMNVYGVSLPGAPGIIIGFNDSISWGLTNNARDVKDYYLIKIADENHYWLDGEKKTFDRRIEKIIVKEGESILDTVSYTIHGPIQYDEHFLDPAKTGRKYAMRWMAHLPSNELKTIGLVNAARNVLEFREALPHFTCPAQNFVYADRMGNIGLFTQGRYVQKWRGQGRFIMDGSTSATLWGNYIPMDHNPYELNPSKEWVGSANQVTTDSSYSYWYNGSFVQLRAWELERNLSVMESSTIADHQRLQNSYHSILAEEMLPVFLKNLHTVPPSLSSYFPKSTDSFSLNANSKTAALFMIWWHEVMLGIWEDDLAHVPEALYPSVEVTMQLLKSSRLLAYYDDRRTERKEQLSDIIKSAYERAHDSLQRVGKVAWSQVKNVSINHLAKIPAFSETHLAVGGWNHTLNAIKLTHGPSWRMIVEMRKDSIRAVGVYPGGQSGYPSSSHYKDMISHWVDGKYFNLLFLPNQAEQSHPSIFQTFHLKVR